MKKKEVESISSVDKYSDVPDFSLEIKAFEKFEKIKVNSSKSLRSSQSRMVFGFVFILLLTLLLGILSFVMSRQTTDDIKHIYDGPLSVRYYALSLNVNAHEAHLSMRNLSLCEDDDYDGINYHIERARANMDLVNEDILKLRSLAGENEALKPKFAELESLITRLNRMREKNIQLALDGNMAACRVSIMGPATVAFGEVKSCISEITAQATQMASADYSKMLNRSSVFDIYLIVLTAAIVLAITAVLLAVYRYTGKSIKLVDTSQQEQNQILDELMVMDETLRQNLAKMEHSSELMNEMQDRYVNSLEAANDAIWELNTKTGDLFASEKWTDITGFPQVSIFDKNRILQFIHDDDHKEFAKIFENKSGHFSVQLRATPEGGEQRWLHIRGKWLDDYRLTGSVSDITQAKLSEQYIEHMAYHDAITHLPNRAMFVLTLEEAIERAKKSEAVGAVLFIDLDNFKLINDSHGHDFGDKLLLEVGNRLERVLKGKAMLARFGGDEFLILIENITGNEELNEYIKAVTDVFAEPFSIDSARFHVTTSIGVSYFPGDGDTVSQILKNSDSAMYESKSAGRNTFALYNEQMSAKLMRKSAIADVLRTAVENGAVYMVYQPQVRSSDNKMTGCESLMRVKDKTLGFISPAEFIPIAEETRLIVPLGYWAVRKVIETDIELRERGITLDSISVNISEIQLREHDFVEQIKGIIEEYSYDASRLHFEITESVLLSNFEEEIVTLNKLRDVGVKIELDDFGTGFSSLNYVRMIPLNVIKIDKCFTDEIGINSEKEGLINLIVQLAGMFNAQVVAEGVETAEQVEFFKKMGNIILQGFYFSKPLEINDLQAKYEELNAAQKGE